MTVYAALRGGATPDSLARIQTAIKIITGKKISVVDISMGKYSKNSFIRFISKKINVKKQGTEIDINSLFCDIYSETTYSNNTTTGRDLCIVL